MNPTPAKCIARAHWPFMACCCALLLCFASGCVARRPDIAQPTEQPTLRYPPAPEKARLYFERSIRTSADIVIESRETSFRRYVTGEQRIGEALAKPYGVAARDGRIYVGDTVRRAVFLFDMERGRFALIGDSDPGKLMMPLGLDVDDSGELFVVDATRKAIMVYSADGRFEREINGREELRRPSGLAVATVAGQRRVYVVDAGGVDSSAHRVVVYDAVTGALLFTFGTRGTQKAQFNLPRDIAIGQRGEVYVVDGANFRVQVFDASGEFLRMFGDVGRQGGQFSRPKEIALDREDNVYVVDAAFGNFQIFSSQGRLLMDVGSRSNVDRPASYMLPAGIAVDEYGRVYMVDQFFRRLDIFRPPVVPVR